MLRMVSTHRGSTEAKTRSRADSSADSLGGGTRRQQGQTHSIVVHITYFAAYKGDNHHSLGHIIASSLLRHVYWEGCPERKLLSSGSLGHKSQGLTLLPPHQLWPPRSCPEQAHALSAHPQPATNIAAHLVKAPRTAGQKQGHSANVDMLICCDMLLEGWLPGPAQLNRDTLNSVGALSYTTPAHPLPRPPSRAGQSSPPQPAVKPGIISCQVSHSAHRCALPSTNPTSPPFKVSVSCSFVRL